MKALSITCLLTIITCFLVNAQQQILSYPFEYEKNFMSKMENEAFFLDNVKDSSFALVLRDTRKAAYALFDRNFKKTAEVPSSIDNTILKSREIAYVGGTASGNKYHFLYNKKSDCYIETVDFGSNSVSNQKLFEIPKVEISLASFGDNNMFYAITANDKTSELVIYTVNEKGSFTTKSIPFKVPEDASKGRKKLSNYLENLTVMKTNEEPDLPGAINSAKLFCQPGRLDFVINDGDNATRIFTLSLPDFKVSEKFMDFESIVPAKEKEKANINSFLKNNKLFSVVLNSKNIRIVAHDLQTGAILTKYEINEDSQPTYAQDPTRELRQEKRKSTVKIRDIENLILAMRREGNGIMISEDGSGKLILTIGSYHYITNGGNSSWTGSNSMHGYTPGYASNHPYNSRAPGYWGEINTRHYITSYCKLLLDPSTLKIMTGTAPTVAEQVNDYIETVSKKAEATNQFAIGKKQYYGYYDPKKKAYVVDQINIQ